MRAPIILLAVLLGSWVVQILHPGVALALPGAPWAAVIVLLPVIAGLLLGLSRPDHPVSAAAGGGPLAIAGLLAVAATCWPIATHPVGVSAPAWLIAIGLGDPLSSLPFAVALLALLVNLSVSLGRRLRRGPDRLRYGLVHAGLLIAIAGAAAGHGGLVKVRFILAEGAEAGDAVQLDDGRRLRLPVALSLDDFVLERFAPMLLLAAADGALVRGETLLGPGVSERIGGLHVEVRDWIAGAAVTGLAVTPVAFHDERANPAARITVRDGDGRTLAEGWLHAPSQVGVARSVALPDGRAIHMEAPRPRRFHALVRAAGTAHDIAVNRPLRLAGWAFYLVSYDEAAGAASSTAVFEAVEDPALPIVYLGIAILALGMAWHLWRPAPPPGAEP